MKNINFIDLCLHSGNLWAEVNFSHEDVDNFEWAYTSDEKIKDEEYAPYIRNVEFEDEKWKSRRDRSVNKILYIFLLRRRGWEGSFRFIR